MVPSSFLGSDEEAEYEGRRSPEVPEWETVQPKREGKSKSVEDMPINYADAKKAGTLTEPVPVSPLAKKNYVSADQPDLEALRLDDPPSPKAENPPFEPLEPKVQQFFDMVAQ